MTTIAQIRTLVPDKPQFDRAAATGDGASTVFELPNAPVLAGSLIVTVAGVAQVEGVDYTVDLELGTVTFALALAAGAAISMAYQWVMLSDDDIQTIIDLEPSTRYAAAQCLDTIAVNQALVQKVIRLLDLTTDGAKLADALRARAKALRDQDDAVVTDASFDIAEWSVTVPAAREIVINAWQRELA